MGLKIHPEKKRREERFTTILFSSILSACISPADEKEVVLLSHQQMSQAEGSGGRDGDQMCLHATKNWWKGGTGPALLQTRISRPFRIPISLLCFSSRHSGTTGAAGVCENVFVWVGSKAAAGRVDEQMLWCERWE